MKRYMKVTIGIEVSEEEVIKWLKSIGGVPEELSDDDWIDYAESKYGMGYGAEASFCD